MNQTQSCLFCRENFTVRDEDLKLYDKLSPVLQGEKYLIPPPQLCPKDRMRRHLAYRNERTLYKRKSSLSGKEIISFFHPDAPYPQGMLRYKVYSHDEWWSDGWDALQFGRDFDFKRSFFEQFHELQLAVPRVPLINNKAENADYCNFADGNRNSYLLTSANRCEDCYYGYMMLDDKNTADSLWGLNCELCYQCVDCTKCYNVRYAQNCEGCIDSAFLLNCRGVQNSLFCINLRNKQYHLFNKPCSKEEYEKLMREMNGSYSKYQEMRAKFENFKKNFPIRRANNFVSCTDCTGDSIVNSKNIYLGFDIFDSKDCAYVSEGLKGSDCADCSYFEGTELCYESTSLIGYGYRFTIYCRDSYNLFYSDSCHACKNCFGCVGLRNKEYCIFNKQYSKEEYEKLMAQIIFFMERNGEWGEFFPIRFAPFAYNETLAQDYFAVTREQASAQKWLWRETHASEYVPQKMALPDNIQDVQDSICREILVCEVCKKNYRIIIQELNFYRKMGLPLPRRCPDTRTLERILLRNPPRLWARTCAKCGVAVQTAYAPERPEKVYCEKCYLETVY